MDYNIIMNQNIKNIKEQTLDKRLNINYRYKLSGGQNTSISATDYDFPVDFAGSEVYTDYSPPIAQMYVSSTSNDDDILGLGAQKVTLIYIDSNGDQKSDEVEMDETNSVNIGTNVREIISFYCSQLGATGYNVGTIYLKNDNDNKIAAAIKATYNYYSSIAIEIPQNGYTYLQRLQIISNERNNSNADIDFKLYLIERYSSSYIYKIILSGRCQYQKSIDIDLSNFQRLSGSQNSSNNFAILLSPHTVQDSNYDSYGSCYLSAINSSS